MKNKVRWEIWLNSTWSGGWSWAELPLELIEDRLHRTSVCNDQIGTVEMGVRGLSERMRGVIFFKR